MICRRTNVICTNASGNINAYKYTSNIFQFRFYAKESNDRGQFDFVLSVVNLNIRYDFLTIRDRDFIFGMHTTLMRPFQTFQH